MVRKVAMPPKGPPPKLKTTGGKLPAPLAGKVARGKAKCACDDKAPKATKGKVTR